MRRTKMRTVTISANRHFGVQLREVRKDMKMTQTELARQINCSPSNVSHFEKGDNTRGNGSIDTAIAYAKGLGLAELRFDLWTE